MNLNFSANMAGFCRDSHIYCSILSDKAYQVKRIIRDIREDTSSTYSQTLNRSIKTSNMQ